MKDSSISHEFLPFRMKIIIKSRWEGLEMGRNYQLDPGYVTIPEASDIVKRMLGIVNKEDKTHYNQILKGAKKGLYGGKLHGKRMYQVRKADIVQYAEELLEAEKIKLFQFEMATDATEINSLNELPMIDQTTVQKLYYFLKTLRFHEIISHENYQNAERQLMLRMKIGRFTPV